MVIRGPLGRGGGGRGWTYIAQHAEQDVNEGVGGAEAAFDPDWVVLVGRRVREDLGGCLGIGYRWV